MRKGEQSYDHKVKRFRTTNGYWPMMPLIECSLNKCNNYLKSYYSLRRAKIGKNAFCCNAHARLNNKYDRNVRRIKSAWGHWPMWPLIKCANEECDEYIKSEVVINRVKSGKQNDGFCSISCANSGVNNYFYEEGKVKTNCKLCGKDISVNRYQFERNSNNFCNREHANQYRRGKKSGVSLSYEPYVKRSFTMNGAYPKCELIECPMCGKYLTQKQISQGKKTCSKKCGYERQKLKGSHKMQRKDVQPAFCVNCGRPVKRQQILAHLVRERTKRRKMDIFCTQYCSNDYNWYIRSEKNKKNYYLNPAVCNYCFEVIPYDKIKRLGKKRIEEKKFCSHKCSAKYKSGSNHPQWKGGKMMFICPNCDKQFEDWPYKSKDRNEHFCSRECYIEWLMRYCVGPSASNWKGGVTTVHTKIEKDMKKERFKLEQKGFNEKEIDRIILKSRLGNVSDEYIDSLIVRYAKDSFYIDNILQEEV